MRKRSHRWWLIDLLNVDGDMPSIHRLCRQLGLPPTTYIAIGRTSSPSASNANSSQIRRMMWSTSQQSNDTSRAISLRRS
jgi:hypothetical protein